MTTHIICRCCGYKITLGFRLRSEAPIHFVVACPRCGYRGVYSYVDVVEEGVYRHTCEICSTRLYSFRMSCFSLHIHCIAPMLTSAYRLSRLHI